MKKLDLDVIDSLDKKISARNNIIGRHRYDYLKQKEDPTEEEKLQIEAFENKGKKNISQDQLEKIISYHKKVCGPKPLNTHNFEPAELLDLFFKSFKQLNLPPDKEFIKDENTKNNLFPLIYYFTNDSRFFKCKNIITQFDFNGAKKYSEPSFEKGLLVIGNYGNGKSSSVLTLRSIFSRYDNLKFRSYTANDVIELYESCHTPEEKRTFWHKMNQGVIYYDDVKTERIASNYGMTNLFKDIIEKREVRKLKTYITCNFKEDQPGNIPAALLEFGEKYGSRVFDRLFSMFNIIEFKGKSFRR